MAHEGGGTGVTADEIHRILDRVPSLIVLDGLDEVGSPSVRGRVVGEIDKFAARATTYPVPPKVVVTTRPSAGELPEPSAEHFDVIVLNQLTIRNRTSICASGARCAGSTARTGAPCGRA
jgi:hypothetical protein